MTTFRGFLVIPQLDVLALAPSVVSDLLQSAYRLLVGGLQSPCALHPLGGRDNSRTQGNLPGVLTLHGLVDLAADPYVVRGEFSVDCLLLGS
jgi:hypothetical protein